MARKFTNIDIALKKELENKFAEKVEVINPRAHRLFVILDRDHLLEVIEYLHKERGLIYISTITGLDARDHFEVLYHFSLEGTVLTIKAIIPSDSPQVDSITPLIPSADLYECEIKDLVGIFPKGHPNLRRIILPDDWPEDEYPLRKDWPAEEKGVR